MAADVDGDGRVDEVCHTDCAAVVSLQSRALLFCVRRPVVSRFFLGLHVLRATACSLCRRSLFSSSSDKWGL